MKSRQKNKNSFNLADSKVMTLGDLIANTYGACEEKEASKILEFAMAANVIKCSRTGYAGGRS